MTIKHSVIYQILSMIIVGVFLLGGAGGTAIPKSTSTFTPSLEQTDKSPFTGIPCAAPCWQGLEVGKSNENDVTAILPTLTFINQKSVQIFRKASMPDYYNKPYGPGIKIVANCINSEKECLKLTTANDILQKIIVRMNYDMRPDEAIRYLGNPDYIGTGYLGTESIICEVYLVWSRNRLVLASRFEDSVGAEQYCNVVRSEGKVPASLPILEARYLSDAELDTYLSSGA